MYTCKICSKTFSKSSGLSRHTNIHKNRFLQCHLCIKTFHRRDNLKRHVKTVHTTYEVYIPFNTRGAVSKKTIEKEDERENCSREESDPALFRSADEYKVQTNDKLENTTSAVPVVLEQLSKHSEFDNNYQTTSEGINNDEVLKWSFDTDPADLVEAIRINIRLGAKYDVYINTLRDMGIIE